jgi:K(+)-stimulated pyrophosphate-energized sodium pump
MELSLEFLIPIIASIASFAVAAGFAVWVTRQNPGTKQMTDISDAVKVGAAAFLRRELKILL